ncbi:MAG: M1 family metallopeptidase, partial [Chitinophagaceae bacterium]|nr:M1 family metallopeptidase [Anaerolineae bacterium]
MSRLKSLFLSLIVLQTSVMLICVLLIFSPNSARVTAQEQGGEAGSEGIGDPYFPTLGNGGYDALHYTLDLTVDVEDNQIEATTQIDAHATQDLSSFNLDFTNMAISEVRVNDAPAEFVHSTAQDEGGGILGNNYGTGELTITPAESLIEGQNFTVFIRYSGEPTGSWYNYNDGIMVAGEPDGASGWYPVNEHPLDKASYTIRVTVHKPYIVAANGLLQDTIDSGRTRTFIWEAHTPMASYLVTLGIGDFDIQTDETTNGIPIRHYFGADLPRGVTNDFDRVPEMIDFFETVFGPYPFNVYGVIVHDADLGFALETQTLAVFGRNFTNEIVAAHELAHQWFGDSVSVGAWQHIWLNEGFATYAEQLWTEYSDGADALDERIRQDYEELADTDREFSVSPQEIFNAFDQIDFDDITLTQDQAAEALNYLLGAELDSDEIDALITELPEGELSGADLRDVIEDADFDDVTLSQIRFNNFLLAVGLDEFIRESQVQIGDPTPDNLFAGEVYVRGSLTLHALRLEIGDEAFFQTLRTYTKEFFNSNVVTDDFIAVAESVSGRDLDDFLQAWLFDP